VKGTEVALCFTIFDSRVRVRGGAVDQPKVPAGSFELELRLVFRALEFGGEREFRSTLHGLHDRHPGAIRFRFSTIVSVRRRPDRSGRCRVVCLVFVCCVALFVVFVCFLRRDFV